MTPKEKAQDLFMSAFCLVQTTDKYGYLLKDEEKSISIKLAKNTVEEILKLDLKIGQHLEEFKDKTDYYSYWEEVKEELEKL